MRSRFLRRCGRRLRRVCRGDGLWSRERIGRRRHHDAETVGHPAGDEDGLLSSPGQLEREPVVSDREGSGQVAARARGLQGVGLALEGDGASICLVASRNFDPHDWVSVCAHKEIYRWRRQGVLGRRRWCR